MEDLIEKDGDWANTTFGLRSAGASVYHIGIFKKWFRQHRPELRRVRNAEVPLWQAPPKKWAPLKVQRQTSCTVVLGREAKKEKTTIVVQGPSVSPRAGPGVR